jgi:hypothetical protein
MTPQPQNWKSSLLGPDQRPFHPSPSAMDITSQKMLSTYYPMPTSNAMLTITAKSSLQAQRNITYLLTDAIREAGFTGAGNAFISASRS